MILGLLGFQVALHPALNVTAAQPLAIDATFNESCCYNLQMLTDLPSAAGC